MNDENLFNLATDKERDRLGYLIDILKSEYFGSYGEWADRIKELNRIVEMLEKRKPIKPKPETVVIIPQKDTNRQFRVTMNLYGLEDDKQN